ncbi:2',3'-cyclic-nucleotide 2'-phosphodiesterase/5'-or 3'-nucleotidase, 5'-nucleotidase family [Psychrobacillus sp. OK028]|uniref:bifunctional metallophosphatase/5'-nucleotidase n=1 Tax=Psychrobacillus sp. OK028 TaxID=1884359 RepID=UPI00088BBE99|nr:bifunctional UDP-sugar hydrolase/5'-nucleotidase [Psychrobacillus sp. OK028]SDN99359.1 2',3'-cyclic-nucleotide 2'-phosphodiesterase/5'-or 3'-nucleotidase, 5'-nucleotidase family [Psychrobacillus sp. OK028]
MRETIYIYHTNDLHSHLENWPAIHQFLSSSRKNLGPQASFLTLDIGDHLDRSNIFTEGTLGKGNVLLLNEAKYDYVTIGNNEGITLSHEDLESLYKDANFEVIVSNFTDLDGEIPSWLLPYKIHVTPSGIKLGIVAATANYDIYYKKLGWHVQEPIPRLKEVCHMLRPQVDIIICMSHLGMSLDEIISLEIPEIDLILGSHTHHVFEEGKVIGNTLQAATGKYGMNVGLVTMEFDHLARGIQSKKAELFRAESLPNPADAEEQQLIWENEGIAEMSRIVFYNPSALKKEWFMESDLSHFFGKALLSFTKADCAMFPAGIFLRDLQQGPITARDLHQCLPHPINPCVITLTGAELLEVIRTGKNEKWPKLEVKGLGFRGNYLGAIIYEQLQELEDGTVLIKERPLELEKSYTLATLDMFTFGYFFPSLKFAQKQYFMPEMIRDIVKWYGRREKFEYES